MASQLMATVLYGEASEPSPWSNSRAKRVLDVVGSVLVLLAASPVMALIAAMIKLTSPGPVLYRQLRFGKNGRNFVLLKFRTMHNEGGPRVTCRGDKRISGMGRILRTAKLDELPQFMNVLRGEMSLVGPRPDLPEYIATLGGHLGAVTALKPGITGAASIKFRHEEDVLAEVPPDQLENYYVTKLLPVKVELDLAYAGGATFRRDLGLLLQTILAVLH